MRCADLENYVKRSSFLRRNYLRSLLWWNLDGGVRKVRNSREEDGGPSNNYVVSASASASAGRMGRRGRASKVRGVTLTKLTSYELPYQCRVPY